MKKKNQIKKILLLFATSTMLINSCVKDNRIAEKAPIKNREVSNKSVQEQMQEKHESMRFSRLPKDQIKKVVESFKIQLINNSSTSAKLVTADSIAVDSAVFVVEATINYDFDDLSDTTNFCDQEIHDFSFPIGTNNQKLDSDDLELAFTALSGSISDLVSSTRRVKLVDVYAEDAPGGGIVLRATAVMFLPETNYWLCLDVDFNTSADINSLSTSQDGMWWMARNLNACYYPIPFRCMDQWYYVVSSIGFSNVTGQNASSFFYEAGNFGNNINSNTVLTPTDFNNLLANAGPMTIAAGVSQLPAGFKPINCQGTYMVLANINPVQIVNRRWDFTVWYGNPFYINC